jgi:hypothetical protein
MTIDFRSAGGLLVVSFFFFKKLIVFAIGRPIFQRQA